MRRILALLLSAVLALGLLAGCAKTQDDNEKPSGPSSDVSMAVVVAGTFGRLGKSTVVSVRMIRASDNVILSSDDGVLVRGR